MTNTSTTKNQNKNLRDFSDSELYQLCQTYGQKARKWSREFGFLLPEVLRRNLHRRRKCEGIHEFAFKIGGLSGNVVDRILSVHEKLKDKPLLWNELRNVGWAKLQVIANIAKIETQEFWLDKLKYSKVVLVEFVKEWKKENEKSEENLFTLVAKKSDETRTLGLNEPKNDGALGFGDEQVRAKREPLMLNDEKNEEKNSTKEVASPIPTETNATEFLENKAENENKEIYKKLKFKIDKETGFKFKKFKQDTEKLQKQKITMGETLKALLEKVEKLEEEVQQNKALKSRRKKARSRAKQNEDQVDPQNFEDKPVPVEIFENQAANKKISRHVQAAKQRELDKKHQGRCTIPDCREPSCENHHLDRFAIYGNHDKIIPVCRLHHMMIHWRLIDEKRLGAGGKEVRAIDDSRNLTKQVDEKVTAHWRG